MPGLNAVGNLLSALPPVHGSKAARPKRSRSPSPVATKRPRPGTRSKRNEAAARIQGLAPARLGTSGCRNLRRRAELKLGPLRPPIARLNSGHCLTYRDARRELYRVGSYSQNPYTGDQLAPNEVRRLKAFLANRRTMGFDMKSVEPRRNGHALLRTETNLNEHNVAIDAPNLRPGAAITLVDPNGGLRAFGSLARAVSRLPLRKRGSYVMAFDDAGTRIVVALHGSLPRTNGGLLVNSAST